MTMEYLRFVLIISFLQVTSVIGGIKEELRAKFLDLEWKALVKCQKEGNLPQSYVDDIFRRQVVPADSKCFVNCLFKEVGFLTDSGDIDFKSLGLALGDLFTDTDRLKETHKNFETCHASIPKDANKCDTASILLSCVFKKTAESATLKGMIHSTGHPGGSYK